MPTASPQASAAARPSATQAVVAAHRLHRDRARQPDIGRQRQIDIAGPERDDEHLPDADDDREDRERQRRGQHAAGAVAAGEGDRREPDQRQRRETTRSRAAPAGSWRRGRHRSAPAAADQHAGGEHDDEDRAVGGDLPVGRNMHEGEQRRGRHRQRQRADHRADRRHPAADEFAAAENDAGDRQQRVAVADIGVGRGGDADQRHARQHAEQRR